MLYKVNAIIVICLLLQDERERGPAQAMTNYPNYSVLLIAGFVSGFFRSIGRCRY
jgi:hypothetical protein